MMRAVAQGGLIFSGKPGYTSAVKRRQTLRSSPRAHAMRKILIPVQMAVRPEAGMGR